MKFSVLDEADAEAIDASNWYEERSSGLGYDFYSEVKSAFDAIEADPFRHPRVEFAQLDGDVRRVLLDRFPYTVIYQVFSDEILVLAVSHASRNQSFWQTRIGDER